MFAIPLSSPRARRARLSCLRMAAVSVFAVSGGRNGSELFGFFGSKLFICPIFNDFWTDVNKNVPKTIFWYIYKMHIPLCEVLVHFLKSAKNTNFGSLPAPGPSVSLHLQSTCPILHLPREKGQEGFERGLEKTECRESSTMRLGRKTCEIFLAYKIFAQVGARVSILNFRVKKQCSLIVILNSLFEVCRRCRHAGISGSFPVYILLCFYIFFVSQGKKRKEVLSEIHGDVS